MHRSVMQDRAEGHLPFCASILPADMPVKDPVVSSSLECEAARILLEPMLSKAGPGGAGAAGSQSQGPACAKAAARRESRSRLEAPMARRAWRARYLAVSLVGRSGAQGQRAWLSQRALLLARPISQRCENGCALAQGGILSLIGAHVLWPACATAALPAHLAAGRGLAGCFGGCLGGRMACLGQAC